MADIIKSNFRPSNEFGWPYFIAKQLVPLMSQLSFQTCILKVILTSDTKSALFQSNLSYVSRTFVMRNFVFNSCGQPSYIKHGPKHLINQIVGSKQVYIYFINHAFTWSIINRHGTNHSFEFMLCWKNFSNILPHKLEERLYAFTTCLLNAWWTK